MEIRAHRVVHGEPDPALRGRPLRGRLTRLDHTAFRLRALLVENLLHQIGGDFGESELAEARVDGSEVGVDDLIESIVLHDVSFRTAAGFLLYFCLLASRGASLFMLFSCFLLFCCFFCCAFTIRTSVCVWHAAIVISIVKSSGYLEENVITVPA